MTAYDLDPIEELRLRRWARENFVPVAERSSAWHSVILHEMESRDRDLSAPANGARDDEISTADRWLRISRIVPLPPDPLVAEPQVAAREQPGTTRHDHHDRRFDDAHITLHPSQILFRIPALT